MAVQLATLVVMLDSNEQKMSPYNLGFTACQ